jgi:hypothetical protein
MLSYRANSHSHLSISYSYQQSQPSSEEDAKSSDFLHPNSSLQDELSYLLDTAQMVADNSRRAYHSGSAAAQMFNIQLPWVRDMMKHMQETYNTVSCYSLDLLPAGTIVYYLSPFILGLDQEDVRYNTTIIGGSRVHNKGRFGIVLDTYEQHVKIVEMSTFGGQGLIKGKPQTVWHEYVEVRENKVLYNLNAGPNEVLTVEWSCCTIRPESAVHVLPNKIGLNSQILIARRITSGSLARLGDLVRALD